MTDLKKEGVGSLGIHGLGGKSGIKVEISIESDPYQDYLNAGKQMEKDREEFGEIRIETYNKYKAAVAKVNNYAKEILQKNKSN